MSWGPLCRPPRFITGMRFPARSPSPHPSITPCDGRNSDRRRKEERKGDISLVFTKKITCSISLPPWIFVTALIFLSREIERERERERERVFFLSNSPPPPHTTWLHGTFLNPCVIPGVWNGRLTANNWDKLCFLDHFLDAPANSHLRHLSWNKNTQFA